MLQKLHAISTQILHSKNPEEETEAVSRLSDFFSENNPLKFTKQADNEIVLQGGVALSTKHAVVCVDDFLRTARYLKGTHLAIQDLLLRFPGQKIHILYAGCGPYATLILPLLPLFDPDQLKCTFLEINPESAENSKAWLSSPEFAIYDLELIETDAITYKSPEAVHLLISETMFYALLREPQVAITANLAPQLIENGILIPEEICLDLAYSSFSEEPFFDNLTTSSHPKKSIAEYAGNLFTLSREYNFSEQVKQGNYCFESKYYDFPDDLINKPDICIFTRIRIYRDTWLNLSESYLTNPFCVGNSAMLKQQAYKLVYSFEEIPVWNLKLKNNS